MELALHLVRTLMIVAAASGAVSAAGTSRDGVSSASTARVEYVHLYHQELALQGAARAPLATLPLHGIAEAIAACESGHRMPDGGATRGTHDWTAESSVSSASGAFQFVDATWLWVWETVIGDDAPASRARDATPHEQYRAFRALWDEGRGSRHWSASSFCWQRQPAAMMLGL